MALPSKQERIRRKKVMQAAGINVPNTDASWGPWWEKQWKKAITHTKTDENYYGGASVWNFMRKVYDDVTGNTTYEAEPLPLGGTMQAPDNSITAQIKNTLMDWQYKGDPIRDLVLLAMPGGDKPVKAAKSVAKLVPKVVKNAPKLFTKEGAKKAAAKVAETVIRETPRASASYAAGAGVDGASKVLTGKSWGENASRKLSDMTGVYIAPALGELTNPGYIGGYKLMDRGIKRAAFNHITPMKYSDSQGGFQLPMTKTEEFKAIIGDVPKQILNFKPIEVPKWRTRLEKLPQYSPDGNNLFGMPISDYDFMNNREDAMRIVFGQPQRRPLYTKNNDGSTYGYNLDYIESQGSTMPNIVKDGHNVSPSGEVTPRYIYLPFRDRIGYGDNLAFNGGYINYNEKNGMSHISDVFDVQPFKDAYRTANIFNTGNFMHKYLPDLEVFNALGGKPFELKMELPTYKFP